MRDAFDARFLKSIRPAAAADARPSFAHTVTWVTPERKPPFVLAILDPKITNNGKMPGKGPPAVGEDGRLVVIFEYPRFPAHPGMFQPPRISDVLRAVSMTWSPPAGHPGNCTANPGRAGRARTTKA